MTCVQIESDEPEPYLAGTYHFSHRRHSSPFPPADRSCYGRHLPGKSCIPHLCVRQDGSSVCVSAVEVEKAGEEDGRRDYSVVAQRGHLGGLARSEMGRPKRETEGRRGVERVRTKIQGQSLVYVTICEQDARGETRRVLWTQLQHWASGNTTPNSMKQAAVHE